MSIKDTKIVNFLTNCTSDWKTAYKNTRTNSEATQIPQVLKAYREHLGRIDNVNSSIIRYRYPHRNRKWTSAFLHRLIKLALHNSRVTVQSIHGKNYSLRQVTEALIRQLGEHVCVREIHSHAGFRTHPIH